ncbi:MAG: peptidoglycan-associated lipoprotein Pal [Rhodospirillaceae bacterium]|jgi:peptidoglycan-associated lipoprotein|nr:peptidoglycan-associated lipoprotein Pal [Rhodospirillaceae bacterium]MBT5245635.1 peptidoglycan-associated lipoprotein Pal [Rhodospirillaceae bacterium]MBT5562345.1 peptidoglycan-associated lipoprotein Pal [Rhodospirillaceae bacterium]MBT6241573.1 peptidoglycan-associated lipoprotein Pal [Rhodospirillaceae bacterium]MBT7138794.1 peptidoglycan-associated lipoprotein Pal [Rhodospirillaceae bacterium]
MRFNILGMIAAVALVAACETAPKEEAASGGSGGTTASSSSSSAAAPAAPMGPKMGSQEDLVVNVGDRVFFDFDKYSLGSESRRVLEKQAVWLKKYRLVTVAIEGHADERGTREYNLALGERRANSAKDYLVALGVAADRIRTISYGKERPVALGSNEAAWAQNRRSVTIIR